MASLVILVLWNSSLLIRKKLFFSLVFLYWSNCQATKWRMDMRCSVCGSCYNSVHTAVRICDFVMCFASHQQHTTSHIRKKKKKKRRKKKIENLLDESLGAAELLDTRFWDLNSNNGTQMSTLLLWFFRCNYSLCQKSTSHSTCEHARTVASYRAWGVSMRCTSSLSRNKCLR